MKLFFFFIQMMLLLYPVNSITAASIDTKPSSETTDLVFLPLKSDDADLSPFKNREDFDLSQEELVPSQGLKDAFERFASDVFCHQRESTPTP